MSAYLPSGPAVVLQILGLVAVLVLGAYLLMRAAAFPSVPFISWLLATTTVAVSIYVTGEEAAGFRMLAMILVCFLGMKGIILCAHMRGGGKPLSACSFLAFALLWPGMRPAAFAPVGKRDKERSTLLRVGVLRLLTGIAVAGFARIAYLYLCSILPHWMVTTISVALMLCGISLTMHFGLFTLMAAAWRRAGMDTDMLFRYPLRSRSLSEFWSRRWNVAYSEMMSLAIFRPVSQRHGKVFATWSVFLFSGVLHELAISVPVQAGFGLPTLYFLLQGSFVQLEQRGSSQSTSKPLMVGALVLPIPLLFHPWFVTGVVMPLVTLN